jgi:hypothetical protein
MHSFTCSVATLAVAGIYYVWRVYQLAQFKRQRTLRERVAYMLWVMANRGDDQPVVNGEFHPSV